MAHKNMYLRILCIIMLFGLIPACSPNNGGFDLSKSLQGLFTPPEDSVVGKDFKAVPFEMAVNQSFESQLEGEKFKFTARYKGTVPNPGPYKSVKDFTNLRMCDLNKPDVCTDLILIKSTYAQTVFSLSDNQPVEVYASLLKVSGMQVGTGAQINFAANNMKAPYMYVRAYKVVPVGQGISSNNNETVQKINRPGTLDIKTAQRLLDEKGYNAGTADGRMGPMTRKALKKFQKDNGLSITGSLDSETVSKLHADQ